MGRASVCRRSSLTTHTVIDFHGVPGSQNGFDNSGHTGSTLPLRSLLSWCFVSVGASPAIGWLLGDTRNRTLALTARVCQWILDLEKDPATAGVVVGFEPMNEAACWLTTGPLTGGVAALQQYYLDGTTSS